MAASRPAISSPIGLFNLSGKTVVISFCGHKQSGCHDFGKTLQAEISNSAHEAGTATINFLNYKSEAHFSHTMRREKYDNVVFTGCGLYAAGATFQDSDMKSNLDRVQRIYIVAPPHFSGDYTINYSTKFDELRKDCPAHLPLELLTSGVDCRPLHSIGLPMPHPILESKYQVPSNCHGIMCHRHIAYSTWGKNDQITQYLNSYFSRVKNTIQAPSPGALNKFLNIFKKTPAAASVIAIGIANGDREKVTEIAKAHGIDVIYLQTKLSQADFIQAIKMVGNKGGIFSTDGVQALLQALSLRAKVSVYNIKINQSFNEQMNSLLPPASQPIGRVMLGLDLTNTLHTTEAQFKTISLQLTQIIGDSTEFLKRIKSRTLEQKEEKSSTACSLAQMEALLPVHASPSVQETAPTLSTAAKSSAKAFFDATSLSPATIQPEIKTEAEPQIKKTIT